MLILVINTSFSVSYIFQRKEDSSPCLRRGQNDILCHHEPFASLKGKLREGSSYAISEKLVLLRKDSKI